MGVNTRPGRLAHGAGGHQRHGRGSGREGHAVLDGNRTTPGRSASTATTPTRAAGAGGSGFQPFRSS
jgi:hypothetical protein